MKRTERKRFMKVVTIVCAAVFLLGCSTSVFAATDLVGRGTTGGTASTATTVTDSTATGTTATAAATTAATTTGTTPVTRGTYVNGSDPSAATTSRVSSQVNTGVMEKIYPFLIAIAAAFVVFMVFFHLQMNQVRYGKSEKYHKELLDFICACRL